MVHEVILPRLGTNIEEGTIVEWRKKEGDRVSRGDVILLVETSKAVFEVESEYDGYLRHAFPKEGERVLFTAPVAVITDAKGEDTSLWFERRKESALKAHKGPRKRHHERKREELLSGRAAVGGPEGPQKEKVLATPAARRLSKELNSDISAVAGAYGVKVVEEEHVRSYAGRKRIAVYGAGLGAKQVRELLRLRKDISVEGLIDDNPSVKGKEILGYRVLGGWEDFLRLAGEGSFDGVVVSLHSEHRRKVIERIRKEAPRVELTALVDPRATVSDGVVISGGAFIEAGSVIGPDTFIGEGVIVDVGAVVSHDCHIGAHSHLSPGCTLSGVVRLEENVLVGVGASINSQVTVGRNTVITPGSAVVSDLPADAVASGNPARIIGRSHRGT